MVKNKLKIAIIDDGINIELMQRLRNKKNEITCLQMENGTCVVQYTAPLQMINHGTVCTLILLESLEVEKVLNDIEIISISIVDEEKQNNLRKLSAAIQWSIDHGVNLISLSIGSKQFITADNIIEESKRAEKNNAIIVAAGSNDGIITYPACLPSVIGVKVVDPVLEKETVYVNPIDGINIQEHVPDLSVLKKLEQDCGYYLSFTNSVLAPVVTAQVASIILQEEKIVEIKDIKKLLAKKKGLKIIDDNDCYSTLSTITKIKNTKEIQIPIITMVYHHLNKNSIEGLSRAVQKKFIKNEYNCVCISDMISENYFEENWFRLPIENTKEWLCFYENFLNANIIILVIDEEWLNLSVSSRFIDAVISEKKEHFDCPCYCLKSKDEDLISQNLFKWIVELFST